MYSLIQVIADKYSNLSVGLIVVCSAQKNHLYCMFTDLIHFCFMSVAGRERVGSSKGQVTLGERRRERQRGRRRMG